MGLKNTVDVNDRKLIDSRSDVRQWRTAAYYYSGFFIENPYMIWFDYTETTTETTYKWWGLTKGAAEGAVNDHDQDECDPDEEASYDCSVDDRVVGSYTLTKTISGKTMEVDITEVEKEISGT